MGSGSGAGFALRFIGVAAVLYALTLTPPARTRLWDPHLAVMAKATGAVLERLGHSTTVVGSSVLSDAMSMQVKRGCDAIEPSELFWAATIAFPATAGERVVGIVLGTLLIQILNVARLVSLWLIGARSPDLFDLFHVEIGQVVFVIIVLGVWLLWLEWVERRAASRA